MASSHEFIEKGDEPRSPEELEPILREKYEHMSLSLLRTESKILKIQSEGSPSELRDRLVRYGLIERFGKEAASWDTETDEEPREKVPPIDADGDDTNHEEVSLSTDPPSSTRRETLGSVFEAWQHASVQSVTLRGDSTLQPVLTPTEVTDGASTSAAIHETTQDSLENLTVAQLRKMLDFAALQEEDNLKKRPEGEADNASSQGPPQPSRQANETPPTASAPSNKNTGPDISLEPSFNLAHNFSTPSHNPANYNYIQPWFPPYGYPPWQWPSGSMPPTSGNPQTYPCPSAPSRTNPLQGQPAGGHQGERAPYGSDLARESRASGLLTKFKISFEGKPKDDVEEFIQRIREGQSSLGLTDRDILKMSPVIFAQDALTWARPLWEDWTTVEEMSEALRLRYRPLDYKIRSQEEFRNRTQGPREPIGTYLSCMRALSKRVTPPLTLEGQLEI